MLSKAPPFSTELEEAAELNLVGQIMKGEIFFLEPGMF
jgi:hypothetical protein